MKKAFSLIELVFVMLLLGVIVVLCMTGFWSQFQKLQQKVVKEAFLTEYQQVFTRNLTSAIQFGQLYTGMHISFSINSSGFSVEYLGTWDFSQANFQYADPHLEIKEIIRSPFATFPDSLESLVLSSRPYKFSCSFVWQEDEDIWPIVISTLVRGNQPYCFLINPLMCRLVEIPCKQVRVADEYKYLFNS